METSDYIANAASNIFLTPGLCAMIRYGKRACRCCMVSLASRGSFVSFISVSTEILADVNDFLTQLMRVIEYK